MASNNLSQYNYCWLSRCFQTFVAVYLLFFVNFAHKFLRWYQFGLADGWVRIYMESVYLTLCSWHLGISQILHSGQRQSNSRCLWVCFADILCLCLSCSARWVWCIVWIVYMHISVGFCVARSDWVGNAKALICGTGNGYRLPRFFISTCNHLQTCWIRGVYRRQDL